MLRTTSLVCCLAILASLFSMTGCRRKPNLANLKIRQKGSPAPDFAARDRNGSIIRLGNFVETKHGKPTTPKDLLLVFFATHCGPCVRELPFLEKYQKENPKQVQVILIAEATDDVIEVLDTLLPRNQSGILVLVDHDERIADKYFGEMKPKPFSYYISRKGRVEIFVLGFATEATSIESELFKARQRHH
ncbi:MAG: TlpA family protein disulfide reductase [Deltaproteobacteria bacterium]|nr:TlpA family protein disulfide reductase [Deltaproteobacteria bacterium]